MKLEICKICYTFYGKDEGDQQWIVNICPVCGQSEQKRELTEQDLDKFLDISFGCKRTWALNSLVIDGLSHTYFEINDLHERKKEMKMMLMYLMGKEM